VLTTPVIRCLSRQLPGAEIHFLTKKQYLPVVSANPYLTKIWLLDSNLGELIPELKAGHFDFIADLHKNYRSLIVRSRICVHSGSFPKLNARKWLTVRFKRDLMPPLHIVDRYFMAVKKLGIVNDGCGLDYFIPPEEEVPISRLPDPFCTGFIAVVIGGKHNTKIFPEDKVAEVCLKTALPAVLLGGPGDRERGDRIASLAGPLVFNGCGNFSLNQSASLVRQAGAVMTNDTGLMHVAAAFRKRIVSVWGNTIPAFGMFPYLPGEDRSRSLILEVGGLSCRPCSKLGFPACPKQHFRCMREIDTERIAEFLKDASGKSSGIERKSFNTPTM
jgi:ADP-heptose:LPS heptosyltransferase